MRPSPIPATGSCGRLLRLAGFVILALAFHFMGA
jgi:hypothetical protein